MTTDRFGSTAGDTCGPAQQPHPIPITPKREAQIRDAVERHCFQLRQALAGGPLVPLHPPHVTIHFNGDQPAMDPDTLKALAMCAREAMRSIRDDLPEADREEPPQPCPKNPTGWCEFNGAEDALDTDCFYCQLPYDLGQSMPSKVEETEDPHHCTPACSHAMRAQLAAAAESDRQWRYLRNVILLVVFFCAIVAALALQ